MYFGIFFGPRTSEAMGLQWKSWTGDAPILHRTAYEGRLYEGRLKCLVFGDYWSSGSLASY
jgi:hypothetical protein